MRAKFFFIFFIFFISNYITAQNLQSPEAFLGYPIGSKFTPHHKIVSYFEHVAQLAATNIKYIRYGKTNEDRPLTLAFISSAENLRNLEKIRIANLQTAKIDKGNLLNDIAIVWLSYNVHGNEPSSSEAAMQTIYELLTKHTNDWLQNTVVIMDPCLNPDGRDRYVNWFNSTVGTTGNPHQSAREHFEPWPGGRVNHYYFDLNRDWAWQSQVETSQRIKIYNQWLPHVHVDFHEQGFNEPYYFAPAAEPMHEVITPWQREFQTTIGKNHAKYFDANGWYFFTKERFDLFYPSYGDTYPTYNGSIGMTYEQGGHSSGGLIITKDDGLDLTLSDRVQHHTTTGLSTIEVSSKNAKKIIENFALYFTNSMNGTGSKYKSYILTSSNVEKLKGIGNLLESNGIRYNYISKAIGSGFNYNNGKTEQIRLENFSLEVNAFQPKSLLAKVLLEPISKLSDTATYDITAWSLPYAYGVNAYACNEKVTVEVKNSIPNKNSIPPTDYAYYVPYHSITGAKTLAQLVAAKVRVYINEKDILQNGQTFAKGTLLIPKKENIAIWSKVTTILESNSVEVVQIATGFSDKGPDMGSPDIKFINAPRIACVTGEESSSGASGEVWHFYEKEIGYPVTMMNSDIISQNALKNFDVLILPDGNYSFLKNKDKAEEIRNWVRTGGRLIAIENAVVQIANTEWGLKLKKEEDKEKKTEDYQLLKKYEDRERDEIPSFIPGAIYETQLDPTHPLAFGYNSLYYTLKQNSELLEFSKDAWNVGVIKKEKIISGFAGFKVKDKLKDGTVIAVQNMGSGAILYFVDNPIFRSFWQNGKLIFFNAAFLVGNNATRL